MRLSGMSANIEGLVSSLPAPLMLLALAVMVIVFIGVLSRINAVVKGKSSPLDYAWILLMAAFFVLVAFIFAKGALKIMSMP